MRVRIDTNRVLGGDALAFIDGRLTADSQWEQIETHLARAVGGREGVTLYGVAVYTDNPNRRPFFTPGQKLRA